VLGNTESIIHLHAALCVKRRDLDSCSRHRTNGRRPNETPDLHRALVSRESHLRVSRSARVWTKEKSGGVGKPDGEISPKNNRLSQRKTKLSDVSPLNRRREQRGVRICAREEL